MNDIIWIEDPTAIETIRVLKELRAGDKLRVTSTIVEARRHKESRVWERYGEPDRRTQGVEVTLGAQSNYSENIWSIYGRSNPDPYTGKCTELKGAQWEIQWDHVVAVGKRRNET